jgi:hypothetical protein
MDVERGLREQYKIQVTFEVLTAVGMNTLLRIVTLYRLVATNTGIYM